jgi:hypothetical protein
MQGKPSVVLPPRAYLVSLSVGLRHQPLFEVLAVNTRFGSLPTSIFFGQQNTG